MEDIPASIAELRDKADVHRAERDRCAEEAESLAKEKRILSTRASRLESEAKHKERLAADDAITAREEVLLRDQWQAKLDLLMSRGGLGDIEGTRYQVKHHDRARERLERSVAAAERDVASKRREAAELRDKAKEVGREADALRKRSQSEHDSYISVMRRIQLLTDRMQDQR